ncbi:unnamed protein product [Mytilus coruscus]|uniref:Uncharacterized protein n=1 Tax=Mytilus coruscus TaxID=42192 RepID=A0A6J8BZ98_MYTCO|nr:unnamed protein product [Mytilus coruscus]
MVTSSSYANATANGEYYNKSDNEINHEQHLSTVKPVFLLESDIFGNVRNRENFLTHEEVYKGRALVVLGNTLQGLQRINGMWRIYVDSEEYRITLLTKIIQLDKVTKLNVFGKSETKPTKKGTLDQFLDPQAAKTPKPSSDKRKPSTPTDTAHQKEIHATRPRTGNSIQNIINTK